VQARLAGLADGLGPVGAPVAGVLLLILGILVVVYPGLLAWLVGLGLVLAGVALLAATLTAAGRRGP
jgi:hypothetical protein